MSVKTAGVGHFAIPTAPAAGTSCTSGAANVFTTNYVQLIASTAAALYITGIFVEAAAALGGTYDVVQLASGGAGSETIIGQYLIALSTGATVATGYRPIFPPIPVANATRIACKTADSVGAKATLITLECIAQSNVVDDGITVGTVNLVNTCTTLTNLPAIPANWLTAAGTAADFGTEVAAAVWSDAVAADFTVAGSIGKSIMNGVALGTGLTVNSLTNLPAIPADWLTAAGTAADFGTEIAAAIWQDTVAGHFTTALSIGKSIMNGIALGTGLTVNTVTNQLTAAQVATGVWQDAVAGDFSVASSIGKSLYIANIAPGAAGGHFISGSNAGTTTFGALTVTGITTHTGNVLFSDGLSIPSPSTLHRAGLSVAGNGLGQGLIVTAGSGADTNAIKVVGSSNTGDAIKITTNSGSGIVIAAQGLGGAGGHGIVIQIGNSSTDGIRISSSATGSAINLIGGAAGLKATGIDGISTAGFGAGTGFRSVAGTTGVAMQLTGGATSGNGLNITTTSGHAINLAPVGANMHGILSTGGNSGICDGIKAVAGTGGVPIRGDLTGNITGNIIGDLSGSVGSVTGAVGSLTLNNDKTGYTLGAIGSAAFTEDYAADGAAPTLNQFLYQMWSFMAEKHVVGNQILAKKLDGSTIAMTFLLDNSIPPITSLSRSA